MHIIKLLKSLSSRYKLRNMYNKMDSLYWIVIQEGMPPSYYFLHSTEFLRQERESAMAAVRRLIAEDMEENGN